MKGTLLVLCLILSFQNHIKHSTSKTKATRKKMFERPCEKCKQKRKLENVESAFLLHMDFIYTEVFVYPLMNKSKWMKVIQISHPPFLYQDNKIDIHLPSLVTVLKWLLAKAKVDYLLYNIITCDWFWEWIELCEL